MDEIKKFLKEMYGFDALTAILLFLCAAINLAGMLVWEYMDKDGINIISLFSLIPLIISIWRICSRQKEKRLKANLRFTGMISPVVASATKELMPLEKDKQKLFRFFKCPKCKQKVRVPKGKGKVEILCPSCGIRFVKKT